VCGITGAVETAASTSADVLTARVGAMADTLAQRGPDSAGWLLEERRLDEQGYLGAARVRAAWDEHCSGRRDRRHELWAILMFEAWLETIGT
jgi:asparagine synthetase B (glutamine-hydrolysing)